jgi:Ca-activated chloride channel homolog
LKNKLLTLAMLAIAATGAMLLTRCTEASSAPFFVPDPDTSKALAGAPLPGTLGNTAVTSTDNLITFSSATDNAYYKQGQVTEGYLYVETKAAKYVAQGAVRSPLNISIVIDRSGSMSGDKLRYVKKAAQFVVDNIGSDDILSIVMYDDKVDVVFPSGKVTNKNALKEQIELITSRGSTNLSGGMLEGYNQVKSTFKNGYVNRVLLLSDGLANVGITDTLKLQEIVRNKNREEGITLSTFGVGADFNENLMMDLAEHGSGNFYFIDSPDKIPQMFERELKGLLSVVAQNMKLTIDLPAGVKVTSVFGYKYETTGSAITVNFRDIISEETKAVLIRYAIPATATGELSFTPKLVFDDITTSYSRHEMKLESKVKPVIDEPSYSRGVNEVVQGQVVLFETNAKLEQAMRDVDRGKYDEARKKLEENKAYLDKNKKYVAGSKELQKQDSVNTAYKEKIKDVEQMNEYDKKMMQKSSKTINYQLKTKEAVEDK